MEKEVKKLKEFGKKLKKKVLEVLEESTQPKKDYDEKGGIKNMKEILSRCEKHGFNHELVFERSLSLKTLYADRDKRWLTEWTNRGILFLR